MERRSFLALLTATVAGCSSTDRQTPTTTPAERETKSQTAVETPIQTPTSTPTPAETGAEAETETPTPGRAAINEVRSTLEAVLAQYRGAGETILATDASATGFDDRQVEIGVAEAKRELTAARQKVVTDRQERLVERLDTVRLFLGTAAETQVALVGAYRRAQNVRESLAAEDATAARESVHAMDVQRRIARAPYETLVAETNAEATAALPALDASTYRAKRDQFEAERRAFGRLYGPLDEFAGGVGQLEAALALRQNGSTAEAEQVAERAAERLEGVSSSLASLADSFETPADSLVGMTRQLRSLAATKATTTRNRFGLAGGSESETATATGSDA